MRAFSLSSSSLLALALCACVTQEEGVTGTTSFRVQVIAPIDRGAPDRPIDGARAITVQVTALDATGNVDRDFNYAVDVRTQFLGTLSRSSARISLLDGEGTATVDLAGAFGPSYLWLEDAVLGIDGRPPTYATGTSETVYFRYPYLTDISTPDLEDTAHWLEESPMQGKLVEVKGSQFGANGRLVVTGVYAQGYTLSDVNCVDPEVGPCTGVDFGHLYIFTFGQAFADGVRLQVGHVVSEVAGGLTEFNGLTEVSFPVTHLVDTTPNPAFLPPPVLVRKEWLRDPALPGGMINLEKNESGLVAVENGLVCSLGPDYDQYGQWKLDIGNGCGSGGINVVTAGAVTDFNPETVVGDRLTRVVGTVRAVNIGSFSVWIVQPRTRADITL